MNRVLLAIGLLATAAGFVTIGFGIPINAFSLGNTLIVAGTIAVAAGLILVGLAAAIGQLRRIAEALTARPLPHLARSAESVEALVPPTARIPPAPPPPVPSRMPPTPRPSEAREPSPPEPRAPERRFAAPASAPAASEPPGPLDWLRAKPRPSASTAQTNPTPSSAPEPAMVAVPDEAPLSPRPLHRPSTAPLPEAMHEPRVWSPGRTGTAAETMSAPEPMPRATSATESPRGKNGGPFDLVWPEHPTAAPASESDKREVKPEMPPPPPFISRLREERAPEKRADAQPKPAERTPAILKSGVIDGMPYTLYADGSIEAELPQGTLRFASVDALRAHLEQHG